MSRLLLTRPLADSRALAAKLEPLGFTCLIAPMLTIRPLMPAGEPEGAQAVVLTSRHAALQAGEAWHGLPAYAVGDATRRAAERSGWRTVRGSATDVRRLASLIRAECNPENGPLLYLRGKDVSADLQSLLPAFAVEERVVYEAIAARTLPTEVIDALKAGQIAGIPFFSGRSAQIFMQCAEASSVRANLTTCIACCLSLQVEKRLTHSDWKRIVHCARPDTPTMIALLTQIFMDKKAAS